MRCGCERRHRLQRRGGHRVRILGTEGPQRTQALEEKNTRKRSSHTTNYGRLRTWPHLVWSPSGGQGPGNQHPPQPPGDGATQRRNHNFHQGVLRLAEGGAKQRTLSCMGRPGAFSWYPPGLDRVPNPGQDRPFVCAAGTHCPHDHCQHLPRTECFDQQQPQGAAIPSRPATTSEVNTFHDATSGGFYDHSCDHEGIDFACGVGIVVRAMHSGEVMATGTHAVYG